MDYYNKLYLFNISTKSWLKVGKHELGFTSVKQVQFGPKVVEDAIVVNPGHFSGNNPSLLISEERANLYAVNSYLATLKGFQQKVMNWSVRFHT